MDGVRLIPGAINNIKEEMKNHNERNEKDERTIFH